MMNTLHKVRMHLWQSWSIFANNDRCSLPGSVSSILWPLLFRRSRAYFCQWERGWTLNGAYLLMLAIEVLLTIWYLLAWGRDRPRQDWPSKSLTPDPLILEWCTWTPTDKRFVIILKYLILKFLFAFLTYDFCVRSLNCSLDLDVDSGFVSCEIFDLEAPKLADSETAEESEGHGGLPH